MMMKLKTSVEGLYSRELQTLCPHDVEDILEQGRRWNLAPVLAEGGSVIFPHTLIRTCGDQIAAVVHGCLDAGAKRVIVLGVIHSLNREELLIARQNVRRGDDISKEKFWGIYGPRFPGDETWKTEYSLENFCYLWDNEIKRRNLKNPPELILAYPCLTNREPWKMPGIEKLQSYLPGSIVVATTDLFHHGVAYHTPQDKLLPISKEAERFVSVNIEKGFKYMREKNYADFQAHSMDSLSDGSDVGQLIMYLTGPLDPQIVDLRLVNTSYLFEGDPSPSWVAASLVLLHKVHS
jgi:hypothetical protein